MQEVSDGPAWLATHMGYRLVADCTLDDCVDAGEQFDAILLPGGMPGAERLRDCVFDRIDCWDFPVLPAY